MFTTDKLEQLKRKDATNSKHNSGHPSFSDFRSNINKNKRKQNQIVMQISTKSGEQMSHRRPEPLILRHLYRQGEEEASE